MPHWSEIKRKEPAWWEFRRKWRRLRARHAVRRRV